MAVPPPANGIVAGYDAYYAYNYQMPVIGALAPQFNGSQIDLSQLNSKIDRETNRSRERRDSQSSKDRDQKASNQIDHDKPPFSRVFVVCSKYHSGDAIKKAFQQYGTVEDVWVVKDKHTKENRGVAYVKFSKMSEACLAVERMDGKKLTDDDEAKPLKVIIAQPKSSKSTEDFNDETALTRLFVVIPKGMEDKDLKSAFEEYGDIEYVQVVKDRKTGERKGFGYVKFKGAYSAALAVENCDRSYRAVMAEPKSAKLKRDIAHADSIPNHVSAVNGPVDLAALGLASTNNNRIEVAQSSFQIPQGFALGIPDKTSSAIGNRLQVQVSPTVNQEQLARLFDLIPGLELCDLKKNYSTGESKGVAVVVYNAVGSAIYAKEKLNGFEYPPGFKLIVRYAPDDDASIQMQQQQQQRPQAVDMSNLCNSQPAYCSVQLPASQPLASSESSCAERLFIVCHPTPPPDNVLKDIFSRFGDLIDVFMLKNKNFGYAKYANVEAAKRAIHVLHGSEILGKRLKVMQAEPPKSVESARKRPRT